MKKNLNWVQRIGAFDQLEWLKYRCPHYRRRTLAYVHPHHAITEALVSVVIFS